MENRKINSYIKVCATVMLLGGLSFLAIGKYVKHTAIVPSAAIDTMATAPADTTMRIGKYNPVVLGKFLKVCAQLNAYNDEFFLSGTLSTINGADTTEKVKGLKYVLNKKGQSMYYRLGNTETINNGGVYVFVDHNLKKLMISKNKRISVNPFIPDLKKLVKSLQSEGYNLVTDKLGDKERIAVVNENHISCKMYRITFDPATLAPKQIYLRLSDAEMPADKTKDKVIEINIDECGKYSKEQQFDTNKILMKKTDHSWKQAKGFEGYELIKS